MSNLYDIEVTRGDTWNGIATTIVRNGVPLDLTNATIKMQLRKSAGECNYSLEFSSLSTTENVISIVEPLSGRFTVEPQVINITPRTYVYDCEIKLADQTIITVLRGEFSITQDITR